MTQKPAAEAIEVRAGSEFYGFFFYVGYKPAPSTEIIEKSFNNKLYYEVETIHQNEDGSATTQLRTHNLGFTDKKRAKNFKEYFSGLIVPN
jgi:hypothetical protein